MEHINWLTNSVVYLSFPLFYHLPTCQPPANINLLICWPFFVSDTFHVSISNFNRKTENHTNFSWVLMMVADRWLTVQTPANARLTLVKVSVFFFVELTFGFGFAGLFRWDIYLFKTATNLVTDQQLSDVYCMLLMQNFSIFTCRTGLRTLLVLVAGLTITTSGHMHTSSFQHARRI